ncbi:hypothetical protein BURK2_01032 [Burkholderiales bacterium]|nr:hypothetical protein BURK2_01032 [Burkholderiales bacterium]
MKPRFLMLLPLLLAACGYKGPLSLPTATPAAKPAASAPAPELGTERKAQEQK